MMFVLISNDRSGLKTGIKIGAGLIKGLTPDPVVSRFPRGIYCKKTLRYVVEAWRNG